MKTEQMVRIGSLRALAALFEEIDTRTIPGLTQVVPLFVARLAEIDAIALRQARPLKPVLVDRDLAFERMETLRLQLVGWALSYAARKNHVELVANLQQRVSSRMSRVRHLMIAGVAHQFLVADLPFLAEAGITAEALAELNDAIVAAEEHLPKPRGHVCAQVAATVTLRRLLSELSKLVRLQLDPLFRPLRRTNPALYVRYQSARKSLSRRATRRRALVEAAPASAALTGVGPAASSPPEARLAA